MRLSEQDIGKIEALFSDHQAGMSRDELLRKYRIRHYSQLGSFIGVLRRLRIDIPVSPNLRNGGKPVIKRDF
jgi:hypothetical protein